MRIVVELEPVEGGDGVEDDLLALAAERDNASGEYQRPAAERAAQDVVERSNAPNIEDVGYRKSSGRGGVFGAAAALPLGGAGRPAAWAPFSGPALRFAGRQQGELGSLAQNGRLGGVVAPAQREDSAVDADHLGLPPALVGTFTGKHDAAEANFGGVAQNGLPDEAAITGTGRVRYVSRGQASLGLGGRSTGRTGRAGLCISGAAFPAGANCRGHGCADPPPPKWSALRYGLRARTRTDRWERSGTSRRM